MKSFTPHIFPYIQSIHTAKPAELNAKESATSKIRGKQLAGAHCTRGGYPIVTGTTEREGDTAWI